VVERIDVPAEVVGNPEHSRNLVPQPLFLRADLAIQRHFTDPLHRHPLVHDPPPLFGMANHMLRRTACSRSRRLTCCPQSGRRSDRL